MVADLFFKCTLNLILDSLQYCRIKLEVISDIQMQNILEQHVFIRE